MNQRTNVMTVVGRQELIAKLEDINAGLHQLELHVQNTEKDLATARAENAQLRVLVRSAERGELDLDELATMTQIITSVWKHGMSIYDPVIQKLVAKLEL